MLTYEKDPRCWLAQLSDLKADPMPERVREHQVAIRAIVDWEWSFLTQPHPELGRAGPVCPFARPALTRGTIFYTVRPGADLDVDAVESVARSYRGWFLELEPVSGREAQYKSINMIFPDLPPSALGPVIEGVQERLKLLYAREGIMIGEFHPGPPDKGGLWNERFRPLRSPLPLLGIRHMVPTDLAFLKGDRESMAAYLAVCGDRVPDSLAEEVRATALRFGLSWPGRAESSGAGGRGEAEEQAVEAAAAGCPHDATRAQTPGAGCPAHADSGGGVGERVPVAAS